MPARPAIAALLLVALAGLVMACQPDPGRKQYRRQAATAFDKEGLSGGKLLLKDDFDQDKLDPRWKKHPRARIVEGRLHIEKNRNEPPVWLDFELPEKVRIEFEARALSAEGDIKLEVFGDGAQHQSGYILVFGAHKNSEDWFARLDEHGKDRVTRATSGVEQGRSYKMAIVRTDQRVRWFVDGEPFLMFDDAEPLRGKAHSYFAFNDWDAPLEFDALRVFDLGSAE